MKHHALLVVRLSGGLEHPVDDAAVKVNMLVQARAKAVDKGHRPDARWGIATGTVFAQAAFQRAQEDAQDGPLQGGVTLQEIA